MKTRIAILVFGILLASSSSAAPHSQCTPHSLDAAARAEFEKRKLDGAMVMQAVNDEAIVASRQEDAVLLPLSTVKLLLFASYLQHEHQLPKSIHPEPATLIAHGSDDAGRTLALDLRHALGTEVLLRDLAKFGFPHCETDRSVNCTLLDTSTADADWAEAMSLGEAGFRVTPKGLSGFLRAVAQSGDAHHRPGILAVASARAMQAAMLETVQTGTARGIRDRLGTPGKIGGKTGTGPAAAKPYDGVFAGLVFDASGAPRYAFATYVRAGGLGGGAAAEISADLAHAALDGRCGDSTE